MASSAISNFEARAWRPYWEVYRDWYLELREKGLLNL
jgi:hypothetical protein